MPNSTFRNKPDGSHVHSPSSWSYELALNRRHTLLANPVGPNVPNHVLDTTDRLSNIVMTSFFPQVFWQ